MNLLEFPQQASLFLKGFFGPGNQITWNDIENETLNSLTLSFLLPWLGDLKFLDRPVLLPRRFGHGRVDWYALAFSSRQSRALRYDLEAFVGPTYTSFDSRSARLDPSDPVDRAIYELVNHWAFRFTVLEGKHKDVRSAIMLMRNLWEARPQRARKIYRPLARILKDFEMALRCQDGGSAENFMGELADGGRLTAQNLLFLKIRYLGTFEKWLEIIDLPEFQVILSIPRPRFVTQVLIQAIYYKYLEQFERADQPEEAIKHFSQSVLPRFEGLFLARSPLKAPEVMKSFMMLAAASDPPRTSAKESILDEYPKDAEDRHYLEKLASYVGHVEPESELDPLNRATLAFKVHDFDLAFSYLLTCEKTREVLEMLLICGYELKSLASARAVIKSLEEAGSLVRQDLLKMYTFSRIINDLNEFAAGIGNRVQADTIPSGWVDWLTKLNDEGPWPTAIETAQKGSMEWQIDTIRESDKEVGLLTKLLLADRSDEATQILRNALPFILGSFLPQGVAHREFKPIYEGLVFLIAVDDQLGSGDLAALEELVGELLELGLSQKERKALVDTLIDVWQRIQSPRYLDWGLDLLDLLMTYPSQERDLVHKFFTMILSTCSKAARRLSGSQIRVLSILSEELGNADICQALETIGSHSNLAEADSTSKMGQELLKDRMIVIYTLLEQVGKRLKHALKILYPDSMIELNHDQTGSKKLASLAREAEIFLIAVQSAKHAATEHIFANRPKHKFTLVTRSRGCSGMLREFLQSVETMLEKRDASEALYKPLSVNN